MNVTITPSRAPAGARLLHLPAPLRLGADETSEYNIAFESPAPLPVGRSEFRVKIVATSATDPESKTTFEDEVRLRIQPPPAATAATAAGD